MSTKFGVDSSSSFPFRAWTNRQTDGRDWTPYPCRRLYSRRVGNKQNSRPKCNAFTIGHTECMPNADNITLQKINYEKKLNTKTNTKRRRGCLCHHDGLLWPWLFDLKPPACNQVGRSTNALVSTNKVNLHWARLVLVWVTVSGFDSRRRHFISVCNQPPRLTQPSTVQWTVNEYQPKCSDALQLGS